MRLVWGNFVVSVWLLIAYGVAQCVLNIVAYLQMYLVYGPFIGPAMAWPIVIGLAEATLWFRAYQSRGEAARVMAAFMCVALALQTLLVPLLVGDIYATHIDWLTMIFLAYQTLSHLAFTAFGAPAPRRYRTTYW